MSRFANTAGPFSSQGARPDAAPRGLSIGYVTEIEDLLREFCVPSIHRQSARQPRLSVVAIISLAVISSGLCASATVLMTANDADAGVPRVVDGPAVMAKPDIDERFSSFLRDMRAIEIGANGLIRIPGSAPVLAMHIEPPEASGMRGRIDDAPIAIPAITVVQDIKPLKRRRVRRTRIAKAPFVAVREKSLFETLFGVPFPIKLFPDA